MKISDYKKTYKNLNPVIHIQVLNLLTILLLMIPLIITVLTVI